MRFAPALAVVALATAVAPAGSPCPSDPGVCGAVIGGLAIGSGAGSAVGASWAQPSRPDVGSGLTASPPSQATLDRLRLAQEWYAYVPLISSKDGLALVQVIDDELVVAQTRSGLVVGLDARTGARQWAYRLPAAYAAVYPVATAGRFVFVANLATLVCLQRLTGQVEFAQSLTGSVTAGPAASVVPVYGLRDSQRAVVGQRVAVYVTINGNRLASFPVPDAGRVALSVLPPPPVAAAFIPAAQPPPPADLAGGDAGRNRTPSLSALPVVVPPYTLYGRQSRLTPSLSVLPSVGDLTTRNPDYLRNNQRSPSISTLPPSVSRAFELSNLRATSPTLAPTWVYGSTRRLGYEPVVSPAVPGLAGARVFAPTAGTRVTAVNAEDGRVLLDFDLEAALAGPPAGPATVGDAALGIFPLDDGAVVAVDLLRGSADGPAVAWRTVVGGVLNRPPLLTADSVYAAGDGAGVARLDLRTGEVRWRTDPRTDRVLAVSEEFVFARDRAGNTQVFAKNAVPVGLNGRIAPVATLPADGYTVPVANGQTDRLLLAADNGLVVSLRDALPRAVRPTLIAPPAAPVAPNPNPPIVNPDTPPPAFPDKKDAPPAPAPVPPAAKKDAVPVEPKKDAAPAPMPKKDAPPKKDGE